VHRNTVSDGSTKRIEALIIIISTVPAFINPVRDLPYHQTFALLLVTDERTPSVIKNSVVGLVMLL
jgi:hypothetical protein